MSFRSCLLGPECRCQIGDVCKESMCDFRLVGTVKVLADPPSLTPLDHSRGQEWWDGYFMGKAEYAAKASRDPSTRCGAVIVRPDKTVASEGFNGFPKGMNDDPALYADRAEKYDRVLHAEENALCFRREPVHGYTMFVHPFLPCKHCALITIQSGIKRVVAPALATHPERWRESMAKAMSYMRECGVEVNEFVGAH